MEDFIITETEFDEELYKKNIEENDFSDYDTNGKGDDLDVNN
jgi:hypothetical protein